MKIIGILLWGAIAILYIIGTIFTVALETQINKYAREKWYIHIPVMITIWILSPVVVVLFIVSLYRHQGDD